MCAPRDPSIERPPVRSRPDKYPRPVQTAQSALEFRPLSPLYPRVQTAQSTLAPSSDRLVRFSPEFNPLSPLQPRVQTAWSALAPSSNHLVHFSPEFRPLSPLQPRVQTAQSALSQSSDRLVCFSPDFRLLGPLQPRVQTAQSALALSSDSLVNLRLLRPDLDQTSTPYQFRPHYESPVQTTQSLKRPVRTANGEFRPDLDQTSTPDKTAYYA